MQKSILFIINGLRRGGMERQLVEMIKVLYDSKINVRLAVLNKPGSYSDEVQQYLTEPILYIKRNKSKIIETLYYLYKYTRKNKINIIHVQDSFSAFYGLPIAKIIRVPLVNGFIRHAGVSKGLGYYLEKIMLKYSSLIIANSKAGLDFYKSHDGYVIYNLINPSRFIATTGSLRDIVMNANFHHLKDHKTFFTAIKKLYDMKRIRSIGLIGDGPFRNKYIDIIKNLGLQKVVKFHGIIDNVEEIIACYGIGVLCSTLKYKEGISNSILEYMGAGLVAIGSDIGGTLEIIKDGINGYLFRTENPDSLVEKIIYVQNNEVKMHEIIKNATSILLTRHDPFENTKKYLKYLEMIK